MAHGVDRGTDLERQRLKPGREVRQVIILQHARDCAGELVPADALLHHVGPGDERPVQRDAPDQSELIQRRGVKHRQPRGASADDLESLLGLKGSGGDRAGRRSAGPAGDGQGGVPGRIL